MAAKTLTSTFTFTVTSTDYGLLTFTTTFPVVTTAVTTVFLVSSSHFTPSPPPTPSSIDSSSTSSLPTSESTPKSLVSHAPLSTTSAPVSIASSQPYHTSKFFHTNTLIGGIFGGFAAGVIVTLAIVFFLRHRLTRSRRNMNAIPAWEGEKIAVPAATAW